MDEVLRHPSEHNNRETNFISQRLRIILAAFFVPLVVISSAATAPDRKMSSVAVDVSRFFLFEVTGDSSESENRGGVGPQQKQNESSSKVQGGSVELVNEKDRDRLFWEACLAS
nr:hypothetical protein Iba_chr08cCG6280 [Ipomoea batatas]